jgi:hypothetical protein
MAVHIRAIHVNLAGELRHVALLHQGLTDFMCQYKGGFVLHVQVASKLQR